MVATKNEQRNNKEQEMNENKKKTYLCKSDDNLFKMLLDCKERFVKTQTKKIPQCECWLWNVDHDNGWWCTKGQTPSLQTKNCQFSQAATNVLWNEQKIKRGREKMSKLESTQVMK